MPDGKEHKMQKESLLREVNKCWPCRGGRWWLQTALWFTAQQDPSLNLSTQHQIEIGMYKVRELQIHPCLILFLHFQQKHRRHIWMDASFLCRNPAQQQTTLNHCKQEWDIFSGKCFKRISFSFLFAQVYFEKLCEQVTQWMMTIKGERLHGIHDCLWEGS